MNAFNPSPRPRLDLTTLFIAMLVLACPPAEGAMSLDRAVSLLRDYLAAASPPERMAALRQIAAYDGPIDPVIQRLATHTYAAVKPGTLPQQHFTTETLRKKRPDDLLYFLIPQNYRPEQPTGLIVFEHGGGAHTPRRVAGAAFLAPGPRSPDSASGDLFAATGMIAVGPSSPDKPSYRRWCLEESDDYIADVIVECKERFHIDPDRVFLMGHSMGGFGAYQAALRYPDRFAAIVAHSGSWRLGYWPALRGTPLGFVNGVHDARPGVRDHSTDVQYGRLTDQILTRDHLEHTFFEHNGAHAFSEGRKYAFDYLDTMKDRRRDPYYDHIGLASPNGFRESYCYPVKDNRWLTLDKTTPGNIDYDELDSARSRNVRRLAVGAPRRSASRRVAGRGQPPRQHDRGGGAERGPIHRLAASADGGRVAARDDRGGRQCSVYRPGRPVARHGAWNPTSAGRIGA